ncbi:MAG: hypothetical protein IKQ13_03125 [Treponema sp.]|nr:hypothetical protein [Treponema sp.]
MSNPGVITLTEMLLKGGASFRVEDNLCESIHIHYKDMRIDLTIKELFSIAKRCEASICDLVPAKNFDLEKYDDLFLEYNAHKFTELIEINDLEVPVKSLFIRRRGLFGVNVYKKITMKTAKQKIDKIESCGGKGEVVVFNYSKVVMAGEEKIIESYLANKESKIIVKQFVFENGKYTPTTHPYFSFIFKWDKVRMKNLLKKIAKKVF